VQKWDTRFKLMNLCFFLQTKLNNKDFAFFRNKNLWDNMIKWIFCCLPWNDKNFNSSVFVFSVCLGRAHFTGLDLQFSLFCGTTKHKVWIFKTCPWKSESLRAQTDPKHEHTSNSVVLSVKFCLPWNTSFLVTNINHCPKQK